MEFIITEDSQNKVRMSLSQRARMVLAEDMNIFMPSKKAPSGTERPLLDKRPLSTIINRILENYYDEAKASLDLFRENRASELREMLSDSPVKESEKEKLIAHLLKKEEARIGDTLKEYLRDGEKSALYYVNKDKEHLIEDRTCADFYSGAPGKYLKCVLEEYAELPFIERTRIIQKKVYKKLREAINDNKQLTIKIPQHDGTNRTYKVYPYMIMSDQMKTRDYLVGYAHLDSEPKSSEKLASFSILRLLENNITVRPNKALTNKEKMQIAEEMPKRSVSYLLDSFQEPIRIKLTDVGKRSYQNKLFSRPEKDADLSTDDVYVFYCSERQAYDYFFSFGKEAEILSPESLRKKFKFSYLKAAKIYEE